MYEYANLIEALDELIDSEIPESAERGGDTGVLSDLLKKLEEIKQDLEDLE